MIVKRPGVRRPIHYVNEPHKRIEREQNCSSLHIILLDLIITSYVFQ